MASRVESRCSTQGDLETIPECYRHSRGVATRFRPQRRRASFAIVALHDTLRARSGAKDPIAKNALLKVVSRASGLIARGESPPAFAPSVPTPPPVPSVPASPHAADVVAA